MNTLPRLNAFFEHLQVKADAKTTHTCPKCRNAWSGPLGDRCGFCSDQKSENAPMLVEVTR